VERPLTTDALPLQQQSAPQGPAAKTCMNSMDLQRRMVNLPFFKEINTVFIYTKVQLFVTMSKHRIERVFGIILLLLVHYRSLGGGQSAFEITAVLVGGFRACKMDGTVPNGGLTCRGLIEGVLVHRWLVEPGGGKSFLSPILVEEGRRPRSRFTVNDCKLGKDRLCEKLLMVALYRRNADKAGQSVGSLAVVGSVVDLSQRIALTESLARQPRLPPERYFV